LAMRRHEHRLRTLARKARLVAETVAALVAIYLGVRGVALTHPLEVDHYGIPESGRGRP
jgi:hypothetical protein